MRVSQSRFLQPISDQKRVLLNKVRLKKVRIFGDCGEVIINTDVDPETVESKILGSGKFRKIIVLTSCDYDL